MGWWQNASDDERMAQVEGGLECRMNTEQIATASRCTRAEIQAFGDEHGLSFGRRQHPKDRKAPPPKESPKAVFDRAEAAKQAPRDNDFMLDDAAIAAWAAS